MGEQIQLTSSDGHSFGAYVAQPAGDPKGSIVVIQEIFGVNAHIREVADRYAAAGYLAIAPALFDRYEPNVQLGYTGADRDKAMTFAPRLNWEWFVTDTATAATYARDEYKTKVAVVGFCLGGTVAWLAAAKLPISAAVGYYGGGIPKMLDQAPKAPIILHFGEQDTHIPVSDVEKIQQNYPQVPVYLYEAGHGFNNDHRDGYADAASKLANERTLAFLAQHLTGPDEPKGPGSTH